MKILSTVGAACLVAVAAGSGACSSAVHTGCKEDTEAGSAGEGRGAPCSGGSATDGADSDASPMCPASPQDDACTACSKQRCCAERRTCEADPPCIQCINSGQTDCLSQSPNGTAAINCDLLSCAEACGLVGGDGGSPADSGASDGPSGPGNKKNGDRCAAATECVSGICTAKLGLPGQPLQFLWCSSYCQHSADCGSNSAGIPDVCIPNNLGRGSCFLTCASDADCMQFPGTICAQGLSVDGTVVMGCTAP
jgi:hypothetical protein